MEPQRFTLKPLPYPYEALEPYIDMETVEIHHDRHQKAYVDNLNKALEPYPQYFSCSLEQLLRMVPTLPPELRTPVHNNAGGVYTHQLYWECMQAPPADPPSGLLAQAIQRDFGSYEGFVRQFSQAAAAVFGSGWCWLACTPGGALDIITTPNQNTFLETPLHPVLLLDVWEHAYYLKYQNKRADYIANWFKLINWPAAQERYMSCLAR